MALTTDQEECLKCVEGGHSLVILGQAGTGKSYLVEIIANHLNSAKKNVQITATTGIAASRFDNGRTIHSWSGILDGRYSNSEATARALGDAVMSQSIKEVDVLIIDEISMLSAKLFDQIEHICRHVRQSSVFLGGIQLICVGDFLQLPPVANNHYQDPGKYAFESATWKQCLLHKVFLTNVHRQSNLTLIDAINELERGTASETTNSFLRTLNRPLPSDVVPTVLYATNFEVDWFNASALERFPGEKHIFQAVVNTGLPHKLQTIPARMFLALKVNSPVILIRNISCDLVNGSRGKVLEIHDDGPVVIFNRKTIKLTVMSFTVYDPIRKVVIAERCQFPIILGFALTIHRSQGMSIPWCEIHCTNIRMPGQMGVAVGRAVSVEGLRIVDYHPANCQKHKSEVLTFCDTPGAIFLPDRSCCGEINVLTPGTAQQEFDIDLSHFSGESDFNDDELKEIEQFEKEIIPKAQSCDGPFDDVKMNVFLDGLLSKYTVTDTQKKLNQGICDLKHNIRIKSFMNEQYNVLASFLPDENVPLAKAGNLFYSKFQAYLSSSDYLSACSLLFGSAIPNHLVCGHIMAALRKERILMHETSAKVTKEISEVTTRSEIPLSAYGKIRYVGGRCVAKVKYRNMNRVRRAMQSGKWNMDGHFGNKVKVDMLDAITISQGSVLETTKYPESISDTFRKQNLTCGLTNINDNAFEFFRELECRRCPIYKEFERFGSDILTHVKNSILNDLHLFTKFCTLITTSGFKMSKDIQCDSEPCIPAIVHQLTQSAAFLEELYSDIIQSYLSVTDNEFRRNLLADMGKKKTMEHRKRVLTKQSKTHAGKSSVSVMDLLTSDRELAHLKLKCMVIENPDSSLASFKKCDLVAIGNIYGLALRGNKNVMITQLTAKIKASANMAPNTAESDKYAGTSSSATGHAMGITTGKVTRKASSKVTGKGKGRGKGKGKKRKIVEDINQDECANCKQVYSDEDPIPWIGCSNCDRWWHRTCGGLENDEDWERVSCVDEEWYCVLCNV